MSNRFWLLVASSWLFNSSSVFALTARLGHETGVAAATGRSPAETLDLENISGPFAFTAYARRDQLGTERNLTNVFALAGVALDLEGHRFQFSLGSHYRHEKLNARQKAPGSLYPAVGFLWSHAAFRSEIAASEFATRSSQSFLLEAWLPFEVNSEFEYLDALPYRWATQIFVHLSTHGGFILGYEPLSASPRAGAWLAPVDSLTLRTVAGFARSGETYFEFSLQYSLDTTNVGQSAGNEPFLPRQPLKKPRRLPKKVPAFATLVKWGLSPVEALRFTREKDACALGATARTALARKNWGCRDAA